MGGCFAAVFVIERHAYELYTRMRVYFPPPFRPPSVAHICSGVVTCKIIIQSFVCQKANKVVARGYGIFGIFQYHAETVTGQIPWVIVALYPTVSASCAIRIFLRPTSALTLRCGCFGIPSLWPCCPRKSGSVAIMLTYLWFLGSI